MIEELGPCRAQEQHLRLRERLGELLEQIEQRRGRPVDVLDDEHRELPAAERADVTLPRSRQRVPHVLGVGRDDRRAGDFDADRPADRLDDARGVRLCHDGADRGPELLQGCFGGVGIEDRGLRLGGLAEGEIRNSLAVGEASAPQHSGLWEAAEQLGDQARLAHARLTEERHELRDVLAGDARGDRVEHRDLLVPADERGREPTAAGAGIRRHGEGRPGRKGYSLPLGIDRSLRRVGDHAVGRDLGALADEHLAGPRGLLQMRRDVDGVPADHELAARRGLAARDHFAGVHADPQTDLGAVVAPHALREGREALVRRERRPQRSLRIVLVRLRDPEDGQERVADEFLGRPAELLHLGVQEGEQLALQRADILRIEPLPERGGAGEVGEQHGHDAPFRGLLRARCAAPATVL